MADIDQGELTVISLHDFEATSEVELGFKAGEELIVLRQDVGGGWWEGKRPGDQRKGLFPASYVKIVEQMSHAPVPLNGLRSPQYSDGAEIGKDFVVASGDQPPSESDFSSWQHIPAPSDGSFTGFAASGHGGSAILNSQHRCTIVVGPKWESDVEPLTITVRNPQKDSKLSGMKQFITYEVLSNVATDPVKRRYKHFFWLHEQLSELFPGVCIPPVPEKQFTGRFEEEFIRVRQRFLELFLNNVARHPLLAASHVFSHFLTASGEKEWKSGKQMVRKSVSLNKPHSKHLGPTYLNDIVYPPNNVPNDRPPVVDRCTKYRDCLERNMKVFHSSCEQMSASTRTFSVSLATFGESLAGLAIGDGYAVLHMDRESEVPLKRSGSTKDDKKKAGEFTGKQKQEAKAVENWCWKKDCPEFAQLMQAVHVFGSGMTGMAENLRLQSEQTTVIVTSSVRDHIGLLQCLPAVLQTYKEAADHYSTLQSRSSKHTVESVLSGSKYEETMANVMMAEFDHYHHWFIHNFRQMVSAYMKKQVEFHQKLLAEWLNAQVAFENAFTGSPSNR